ncbi:hypothetical protein BGZ83_011118 [Gryganskiella cystojenkinii]|nr:hypothetical protein BGZ83_011118 [Gryganskiella cystojenkinii]
MACSRSKPVEKPPSSLFAGFNVAEFTIKATTVLQVDITITMTVKVSDYQATMPYIQTGITTNTDQPILKLLPIVGTPVAEILLHTDIYVYGVISNTGPLDAQIMFPNPIVVSYNGKTNVCMMKPTVSSVADKVVADNTDVTVFALNNAKLHWTISTSGAAVTAMGAPIPGV